MAHEEQSQAMHSEDLPPPAVLASQSEMPPKPNRLTLSWQVIGHLVRRSAFCPTWLPAPWNTWLFGYTASLCLPLMMALFTQGVLRLFPTFALRGIFEIASILLVALLWGTGPGLVATTLGALLLNVILLPPLASWNLPLVQSLLETGVFLTFGIAISLMVSRIEYAHHQTKRARQRVEHLLIQVQHEKEQVAAHASELEAIIASIADGVYVYDRNGQVVRTNPTAQSWNPSIQQTDYLARPAPERFASFLPRDEQGQPFTQETLPISRILRGETLMGTHAVDTLLRMADGKELLFNVSGAPIRDAAGRIQGGVIVVRDVSERRRMERESVLQARQLSILFEAVPDAITVLDQQGRIEQMNQSAQQLLARYTTLTGEPAAIREAQVQPRTPDGSPLDSQATPAMRLLRGETLTGSAVQDVVIRTFDGDDLWLSVAGAPLSDEDGHSRGAVAVIRDVTKQQRTAQRTRDALRALLQFAEAVVRGEMTEGIEGTEEAERENQADQVAPRLAALMSRVLSDHSVSLTTFDEQTHQPHSTAVYGLSSEHERAWRERRRGFTIGEVIKGTTSEARLLSGEAVVLDLGQPSFFERPTIYGDHRLLLVPMVLSERLIGIVTFLPKERARNYTQEELALSRVLAQLAAFTLERTRLFQERTQAQATVLVLRETTRLMDEFIGIAGHELRTPLTTIKASVQLARRETAKVLKHQDRLTTDVAETVTMIQRHLDRTERQAGMQNRLVSDLLDVARIHSNRLELHPQRCDLVTLVRESVEDQQYLSLSRTITLISNVPEEVLMMADADRVQQVIANYLSNALKYSVADKPVEVDLDLVGAWVRVSVRDEGPGLSSEQQQRIWERFYRVPEVEVMSGSGVGLGLGLHISRMMIERLGGQVGVESVQGKGSTFWFTIPLLEKDTEEKFDDV